MVGVSQNFVNAEKGVAKIKVFNVSKEEARNFNLRSLMSYDPSGMLSPGDYVKLFVNGILMMSDTDREKRTNFEFVRQAHGEVVIAGLGIGLILENLKEKVKTGKVTRIVVYEKYQDVIDLVAPVYADMPLEIRCADILEYKPERFEKYDTIYFDIWPDICVDNLSQIAVLHQRWKSHKKSGGWMDSWMSGYLRAERKRESRYYW